VKNGQFLRQKHRKDFVINGSAMSAIVEIRQPWLDLPTVQVLSFSRIPIVGEYFMLPDDRYLVFRVIQVVHHPLRSGKTNAPEAVIFCVKADRVEDVDYKMEYELRPTESQ
jgi:hypothetical protein